MMDQQLIRGASWKALAVVCFASINGFVKLLTQRLPFAEVAFFEHLFASLCLAPFLLWNVRASRLVSQKPTWHLWRVFISVVGVLLWYQALNYLPMAHAVALGFLGPLMTSLGAIFFLKELPTLPRMGAIGLGLLGGMLVSHSFDTMAHCQQQWYVLFPIASSLAFSCSTLLNKRLTAFDPPLLIVASLIMLMTPFFGLLALPTWVMPSLRDCTLLCVLGGLTALAHFAATRSFACGDVLFLLPLGSLRFILTALIGLVFFGQSLDLSVFLGFFAIVLGLVLLGLFEKRHKGYA